MTAFLIFAFAASTLADRGLPSINENTNSTPTRARRFIHRHACIGIDGDRADTIRCAESDASTFEHMLTPSMLWCNDRDCLSEFNKSFDVHTISCTPMRCDVQLHCSSALESVKYSVLLTLMAILVMICAPFYISVSEIKERVRQRIARQTKQL